jgi:hypothetical protein
MCCGFIFGKSNAFEKKLGVLWAFSILKLHILINFHFSIQQMIANFHYEIIFANINTL